MNPALKLAPALTAARLKSRKGDAWLDVLAVVSFAISALMALTVAGGIWMFRGWSLHPTASMLATAHGERSYLDLYLSLGIFAAALLVIPIFSSAPRPRAWEPRPGRAAWPRSDWSASHPARPWP